MKKFTKVASLFLTSLLFLFPACEIGDGIASSAPTDNNSSSIVDGGEVEGGNDYVGEHIDENADDVCDQCKESVAVKFDVFGINDLHGKILDTSAQPGVDEMTTYLKNVKANNPNTIILSSGDMWQGSPESNLTRGAIMVDWMNDVGFASMTLGNHEYDWGEEAIVANSEIADFPFLGINVFDTTTNKRVDYCQPSVMIEKSGVKIGIIGAEGNVKSSISADKVENVNFKTGSQLTTLVKEEAQRLRAQGADCIIYSIHDGLDSGSNEYEHYDETLSNGYVDIVFEAHTHQTYIKQDDYGVYHVQSGGDNSKGIAHAEISVNYVNSTTNVAKKPEQITHAAYTSLTDDPIVESLSTKYQEAIATGYEELGTLTSKMNSSTILQKCAELYLQAGEDKWGASYQIVLGGGFMKARSPYDLSAGKVFYGDVLNILPFDNELVLCSIKGRDLNARFIQNVANYYEGWSDYGETVRTKIVNGEGLNDTYYVVVDTYSSQYSWNNLTEIARYDAPTAKKTYARDLFAQYLRENYR